MQLVFYKCVVLILFNGVSYLSASDGDRSPFYQKCVKNCVKSDCTKDEKQFTPTAEKKLKTTNPLFMWNCLAECRYNCMWRTVEGFQQRGYDVPKFHGKWPFKRIYGVQEPGSAFASLLNLAAHVFMHVEFTRKFSIDDDDPRVFFWHFFAAVCMNAWIWSLIFHTRDSPFTEFMDYGCALSMVMIMYIAAVIRVFSKRTKLTTSIVVLSALVYAQHLFYLYSARVDYHYNMMVNLFFGVCGSLIWLWWGAAQWLSGRRYAWRLLAFVLLSAVALSLELLDFPPYYHIWDAHALWHLATVPLPLLFYRFVIDDLQYTRRSQGPKEDLKLT
ncbi:Post-GPI attachment to proteins factor 3 [Papilio machaon]|uniref:Post-GPI attachment to proteins factor 3 n=1 Tax=Papilio machaon TaxID=76193 RepID=A0A0N1INJ4_PAPMA|nr:Post-GPI attachment to proteins factor 3 [Papilio machaon]